MSNQYQKSYKSPRDSEPADPGMTPCPKCGNPLASGALVCGGCGQRVGGGGGTSAGGKSPVILAAVGMAVLIAGAAAAFILMRSSSPAPETAPVPMVAASSEASLALAKTEFAPGEEIKVKFTAPGSYDDTAWVGIIPSEVAHGSEAENDKHDISYQYLKKRTSGELTFTAPTAPGKYDLRLHTTDNNGAEVASVSFAVTAGAGESAKAELVIEATRFAPGQPIKVRFSAPPGYSDSAWVGIVPSSVPHGSEEENDRNDLTYQYLNKRTAGELTFAAPKELGEYDFRMNDNDESGVEVASVSFVVVENPDAVDPSNLNKPLVEEPNEKAPENSPSLLLAGLDFSPGARITVSFTAPASYPPDAWVGIVPSEIDHGDAAVNAKYNLGRHELDKRTSGELVFVAPDEPGDYDVRMFDGADNGEETASASFTVSGE